MATEALTVAGLLQKGEDDFDTTIKAMHIKTLMDVISGLQKEMAKEQDNFNSLSGELQNRKEKNSRQSKQISKDMMTSQQRLTTLMNRSMKCFAQARQPKSDLQNIEVVGKKKIPLGQNASVSKGTQLKRRNSAKGLQPVMAPADKLSPATNIHRSRSMHSVNHQETNGNRSLSPPSAKPNLSILSPRNNAASSNTSSSTAGKDTHTPVIMKPSVNGGVASTRNINSTSNINSSNSVQSGNSSATGERITNGKTGIGVGSKGGGKNAVSSSSSSSPSSSSTTTAPTASTAEPAGGGIYVKRKQNQKVLSTSMTNFFSSPQMTLATPPTNAPSSSSSSSSSSTPAANAMLPPKAPSLAPASGSSNSVSSTQSPSGRIQILQTKQRPPNFSSSPSSSSSSSTSISNPLLMAQSRPGLSKSQIIGGQSQNKNTLLSSSPSSPQTTPADELRGLPSVKMLAQSFGSNTALHTTGFSTTTTNNNNNNITATRRLSAGSRAVSRSSSSVCFGQSKNPHVSSSNRIFLSKTNSGENPTNISNNTNSNNNSTNSTAVVMNGGGKIQQVAKVNSLQNSQEHLDQRRNQNSEQIKPPIIAASAANSNSTNGDSNGGAYSELEMARARLKSNRNSREVLEPPETVSSSASSTNEQNNSTPSSSSTENTSKTSSSISSATSSSSSNKNTTTVPQPIPASSGRNDQQPKQSNDNDNIPTTSTSTSKPQDPIARPSGGGGGGGYVKKSGVQGVTKAPTKPQPSSSSSSSTSTSKSTKSSSATISLSHPDPGNMRRSKSREELQSNPARGSSTSTSSSSSSSQQKMPDRDGLLKQIEARRVDPDDGSNGVGGGSNFQSMAKLSRSMPSLLAAGKHLHVMI